MKRFLLTSLAGLFLASLSQAQDKQETIEGNGKQVTRDVAVSSFDALQASGVYQLKLSQGNKESVKIEADENLQEYFTVRNEGNKLVIDMDKLKNKNLKHAGKLIVSVTFKKLKALDLSMVGNVVSEESLSFDNLDLNNHGVGDVDLNLSASKVDIDNTGVGNVKLKGKATEAKVKNSGVGSLQAGSFVVQNMNIENTGVGNAEVNAEKDLKVKDSYMGKVKNRGSANIRKMNKVRV
jgi:hypothetical protein